MSRIESELAKMKQGELKHVRTPEGLVTVKKGKKEPTIIEDLNRPKKSKVIQGVRAVGPAGY